MLDRAQELINKLSFEELEELANKVEGIELLPMIMDRMEELDEKRFLEFANNTLMKEHGEKINFVIYENHNEITL